MDDEFSRDENRELSPDAVLEEASDLLADDVLGDLGDDDAVDDADEFDEEFGEDGY